VLSHGTATPDKFVSAKDVADTILLTAMFPPDAALATPKLPTSIVAMIIESELTAAVETVAETDPELRVVRPAKELVPPVFVSGAATK
jgi:hypothetical protein